ncbi:putative DsbA family dithiol-disulfide isomerase [Paenibacillus sp. V4I3]|uniref:DsbA family protein n=1 Tax=Paenibacillus sp. V4I3 TaxID=3042305 RepID=UPI00277ECFD3|nr:DsbA family protein [Paenibacillus sp. V4I3]MDQ0878443.1 putative DsbA family dithiol-disulfide isomerase [Paenibacillus sp. V4I3]
MKKLMIDVYMDTMCPWCRMGTTSLRTALKQLPEGTKAIVRWHAYRLILAFVLKEKIIARL